MWGERNFILIYEFNKENKEEIKKKSACSLYHGKESEDDGDEKNYGSKVSSFFFLF